MQRPVDAVYVQKSPGLERPESGHSLPTTMRRFLLAILVAAPLGAQQPSSFDFSIRNIMRGPELYGRPPADIRWSADSRWIYFNWVEPGSDWRETPKRYRVRAVPGSKPERVSPAQFDSVGALATTGDFSSNRRFQAVEFNGDLYLTDMQRGTTRRLTETLARESQPRFSPDASKVYFIRDNNVFSLGIADGFLRQLTDLRTGPAPMDSAPPTGQRGRIEQQQRDLFEAIRDQVRADSIARAERLERESRSLKTYYTQRGEQIAQISPAPDANALLFSTRTPAQGSRGNEIPRYVTRSGYTEPIRGRDNVGDVQAKGRVALVNLRTGNLTWLNPYPTDTANGFVQLLGWTDDGRHGALYAYTSDNKVRNLQIVDQSGKLTTIETLRDTAWVGGPCSFSCAGWYDSGRRFYYV